MLFDSFSKVLPSGCKVLPSGCKVLPSGCKVLPSGSENYVTVMCWIQFLLTTQTSQTKISFTLAIIYLYMDVDGI
jgi:hypothetical protein